MCFWRSNFYLSCYFDSIILNLQPPFFEIYISHAESDCFTPSNSAVPKYENKTLVLTAICC